MPTAEMRADMLTKPLDDETFARHRDAMMNTSAETREAPIAQAVMMFPRKDPKTAPETQSRYTGSGGVLDGGMTVTPHQTVDGANCVSVTVTRSSVRDRVRRSL